MWVVGSQVGGRQIENLFWEELLNGGRELKLGTDLKCVWCVCVGGCVCVREREREREREERQNWIRKMFLLSHLAFYVGEINFGKSLPKFYNLRVRNSSKEDY